MFAKISGGTIAWFCLFLVCGLADGYTEIDGNSLEDPGVINTKSE